MRIVWLAVAFLAGTASGLVWGISPGFNIPAAPFWLFTTAIALISLALTFSGHRAALTLLALVFLLGCWRGGDAIDVNSELADAGEALPQAVGISNLDGVREGISDSLQRVVGYANAGLPIALLTGERSYLNSTLVSDFRAAGLSHLLAISGLHVSLVGGSAAALFLMLFGRRRAYYLILPLTAVLLYAALAGFAPPVTRAAIMFGVFTLGRLMGRGSHTIAALALAGLVMVAIDPSILASLSFQLSFAAMVGISLVTPALDGFTEIYARLKDDTVRGKIVDRIRRFTVGSLIVSIASSVGTIPLIALHFEKVPLWSPIATLVAVPVMPILIISSGVVSLIGLIPIPLLLEIAAIPVWATTQYLTYIAGFFAMLPPGPLETGSWAAWPVAGYYMVLTALILNRQHISQLWNRVQGRWGARTQAIGARASRNFGLPLAFAAVLIPIGAGMWAIAIVQRSDGADDLSLKFLEVSHGEAMFIETPNGNRMVIDGGRDPTELSDMLTGMLPFWDRDIDVVMLTHSDADHVGGLAAVLNRFTVGTVIHSGVESSTRTFEEWSAAIESHPNVSTAWPGMVIALDDEVFVEIISSGCGNEPTNCTDINDASIVARLH